MVCIAICIDAWLFYTAIEEIERYRRGLIAARWRALAHQG